ncbi:MAG: DUF4333 domain-containing protein [Mycobacterium sp.]
MTRPPGQGQGGEPWWARPGGAQQPGGPAYPPPSQPRPPYPPRQQPRPPYPPPPQQPPPYYPPPQQPRWQPSPPQQPVGPPPQRYGQQPAPPQPPASPPPAKQSRLPMLAGAAVAVVVIGAVALIGGLWVTGFFGSGTVLDVGQAEAGVTQILSDPINGYGANDVSAVKCNDGKNPEVEVGQGFTCDVTINGAKRKVQVVFRDDVGTYEVDGPR